MHSTAFFVWGETTAGATLLRTLLIRLITISAWLASRAAALMLQLWRLLVAWRGDLEVAFAAVICSMVRPVVVGLA